MLNLRTFCAVAFVGTALCFAPSAKAQQCSNPAITNAYQTAVHRAPIGSGNQSECNPALYGSWTSQADLNAKVLALATRLGTAGTPHTPVAPAATVSMSNYSWYVDPQQNLKSGSGALLAPAGTYDLMKPDGSAVSLVAAGGGNLVAAGGGNLVAAGGGNMTGGRTLQSVGGKKHFIVQK